MTTVATVPFHGTNILTVEVDDRPHIVLKPFIESLGLSYAAQFRKLQDRSWATVAERAMVAADGKTRTMTTVELRTALMLLATINENNVAEDKRDLLIAYQSEVADVIESYWTNGGAINPRASEHQINALIRQSQMQIELCQAAKGLIHQDHLEARARVVLARGLGEHAELDTKTRPLYTQTYLAEKNLSAAKLKSIAPVFGKRLKKAYIEDKGQAPAQYPLDLKNGQVRNVNAYTEADRALMDQVWETHYESAA